MNHQAASLSIAFLTDATHIGSLTRVQPLMCSQAGVLSKPLETDTTHIRLLSRVHFHMPDHAAFFAEGLSANSAGVGHLSGTHFHMSRWMVLWWTGQVGMKLSSKLGFLTVIGKIVK